MEPVQVSFISFFHYHSRLQISLSYEQATHINPFSLIIHMFFMQQQTPQNQIEQTAIDFCEAFYNFNYPVAKEWSTPSSLSYLSFLASNVRQTHLDQLKAQGAAKVSIVSSEIDANLRESNSCLPNKECIDYQSNKWGNETDKRPARYARTGKRIQ